MSTEQNHISAGSPLTTDDRSGRAGAQTGPNPIRPVANSQRQAERLRMVAKQVESFLMRQIDRLQHELEQSETQGNRGELELLTAEFEAMRRKWDAERQQERNRIQEDSQRLAEAWQRLEEEQREILKYRVSSDTLGGIGPARSVTRANVGSNSRSGAGFEPTLARTTSGVATAAPAGHKNRLQFQQLRREMMEHARQRRKR